MKREKKVEEKRKNIYVGPEEIKWFSFAYIENTQVIYKKNLLELISKFIKITGYKINIEKLIVFLCTSNEHLNTKILNAMIFIISLKRKKEELGVNVTKYVGLVCWKWKNAH